jgi:hypothetical protein
VVRVWRSLEDLVARPPAIGDITHVFLDPKHEVVESQHLSSVVAHSKAKGLGLHLLDYLYIVNFVCNTRNTTTEKWEVTTDRVKKGVKEFLMSGGVGKGNVITRKKSRLTLSGGASQEIETIDLDSDEEIQFSADIEDEEVRRRIHKKRRISTYSPGPRTEGSEASPGCSYWVPSSCAVLSPTSPSSCAALDSGCSVGSTNKDSGCPEERTDKDSGCPVESTNKDSGCPVESTYTDSGCPLEKLLTTHLQTCRHRQVRCPHHQCVVSSSLANLGTHLRSCHISRVSARSRAPSRVTVRSGESETTSGTIVIHRFMAGSSANFRLASLSPQIFRHSGKTFYLQTIASQDARLFYIFVQTETQEECERLWTTITVASFNPDTVNQVRQTIRPTSLDLHCRDDLRRIGEVVVLTERSLLSLVQHDPGKGRFQFKIEVEMREECEQEAVK